jgi:hypothetical protein
VKSKILAGLLTMGVLVLGAAAVAAAQNGRPRGGPPDPVGSFWTPELSDKMTAIMYKAQDLERMDDPEVRAQLSMTPEQEKKYQDIRDRAAKMFEDLQSRGLLANAAGSMTPEEERAVVQDFCTGYENLVGDAENILTPGQRSQLPVVKLAILEDATGGLGVLLTQEGRDGCGLTADHVEQIRPMIDKLRADWKGLRDKAFGADKGTFAAADMQTDKYKEFKTAHQDLVAKTKDRILTLFMGDHRTKVEKFLAGRVNKPVSGGRRVVGGPGGPAANPVRPPAMPSATAPASPWSSN